MPTPGQCWWHLILTARGQWLPGDPRGFRSRGHRLHSSGDYKHRPPEEEHVGLHRHQQQRSADAVHFPATVRPRLGKVLLAKANDAGCICVCVAAGPTHSHLLIQAGADAASAKKLAGQLKQAASHTVRDTMPGRVWADGGKPIQVESRGHQLRVFRYILGHAREGSWVWRFDRDDQK